MTEVSEKRIAVFLAVVVTSFVVAATFAILMDVQYGYSPIAVFSIIATSEGIVLAIYQIVFVPRIVDAKIVSNETEKLRRALELTTEYIEADAERNRELANKLEEASIDVSDIEFYEPDMDDALESLEETVREATSGERNGKQ